MTQKPTPEPRKADETRPAVTAEIRSDHCADCGAPLVDDDGNRGCILCGTVRSSSTGTYELL